MGMEEGHGGGSRVQGDEGGRQGAGQAPGKEALPRDHLENIRKYQKISGGGSGPRPGGLAVGPSGKYQKYNLIVSAAGPSGKYQKYFWEIFVWGPSGKYQK